MIRLFCLFIIPLILAPPALAKEPIRIISGVAVKISDGDTFQLRDILGTKVKVRLYGIDAPETEKRNKRTGLISKEGQPFGEEASDALRDKIFLQPVRIEVMAIDRHKRLVALVKNQGRDINMELVAEGYAWAYRKYLTSPYASDYIGLEEQARKQRRGLWQQNNPLPPWDFRKLQRERNSE